MRREQGADAASVGVVETANVKPASVETDFAAALLMIAGLPLSDADKADAVRRLLKVKG